MGLIRKTLSVGTAGVVKGSSKKQRVAKSTERAARSTAAAGAAAAAAADLALPAEKMHFAALDSGPAEGAPGVPPPG